jgi:hypothetical protein
MNTLEDALEFRHVDSTRALARRFDNYAPRDSMTALLRRTGPFVADRDAFRFTNQAWPITEEDARTLRERFQPEVDGVALVGVEIVREALLALRVTVPVAGPTGLPAVAIDYVIDEVTGELRNRLLDTAVHSVTTRYGRCGGMAFAGYDFFQVGWPVAAFGSMQPASGDLREFIWRRLLDSLELNAHTFLEWLMVLHVLPAISVLASAALGAAAGSLIGGPLGAAVGALVSGGDDVLELGGRKALLGLTREHCRRLASQLEQEAAWPVGLVYGGSASPIDQHQVLAIGWLDRGDGTARLRVWDNVDGARARDHELDLRGSELTVATDADLKGIICERYAPVTPPVSLRR